MRILFVVIVFSISLNAFGQQHSADAGSKQVLNTDTIIDSVSYKIITRFKNGKVKLVGNYMQNCTHTKLCKYGKFTAFNEKGKKEAERIYFFDKRICRKFLGLKQGQWGFYGNVDYYFLGFVTKRLIVDPCF